MTNSYPEKPVVPYAKTPVAMQQVIDILKALTVPAEVKRTAYIFIRNESANGSSCFNYNCGGIQADSGRWPSLYDKVIRGVVVKNENRTGKQRYFCAFTRLADCVNLIAGRVQARGIYVGGYAYKWAKMQINNPNDLATAYKREWVLGSSTATPSKTEITNFLSMYRQSATAFPS